MGGIGGRRGKAWRSAPLINISRRLSRHEYLQQSLRRLLAHRALETTAWKLSAPLSESVVRGSESLITARVAIKEHVWRKFRKLCTHLQIFFLSSFIFYLAVEIG